MGNAIKTVKTIPQTTLRRLINTPSYFFLIWRWVMWLFALIWIISVNFKPYPALAIILLSITFLQTLIVTLYAPVFQIFLPGLPGMRRLRMPQQQRSQSKRRIRRRPPASDEETDILTPIATTRNPYWGIAIYGLDVTICGLVMYFGGVYG
ncbi:MAG: hypothetical protein M3Z24_03485, partial [Chloroflexota bacterium]|nr:hypothetical protein [Chloroflexota bacterium]